MAADDGVAEGVGDGDPAGLDDAPGDADGPGEAEGDPVGLAEEEGLPDGAADGLADAEPDGLAAGDGEALADGDGATGGVVGVGVGSSAFAYAGNMASSARPSTTPSRNVRNIHR